MNKSIIYLLFICLFLSGSCIQKDTVRNQTDWQTVLKEKLPLLGHRNWIVVTDMAYPSQAKKGITTELAKPYTSTFFELDCKYWDNNKQTELNKKISSADME